MVGYSLLVAGAKQKWSKLGLFSPMVGAKQKLSKLGSFSPTAAAAAAATISPPSAKRRLPEFATIGLYSMFAGVCGGAGYAAYANRVDASNGVKLDKKDLGYSDEALWILYKRLKEMEKNEIQKTNPWPRPRDMNIVPQCDVDHKVIKKRIDENIQPPKSVHIALELHKQQGNGGHKSSKERKEEIMNVGQKSPEEQEKELQREREELQLLKANQAEEDNARKRMLALKGAEKAEERRATEISHKLEADKERRRSEEQLRKAKQGEEDNARKRMLALNEAREAEERRAAEIGQQLEANKSSATKRFGKNAELLSESLRTLRRSCKNDDAKAKKAFETLQIYVRNVIANPDEDKYRRIRLTNPAFQDRVGSLRGGTRFLELCGFDKTTDGQFLHLRRDKVNMAVLHAAMRSLESALLNPFFGLLSVELPETSSTG